MPVPPAPLPDSPPDVPAAARAPDAAPARHPTGSHNLPAWRRLLPVLACSLGLHLLVLGALPDFATAPASAPAVLNATLVLAAPAPEPIRPVIPPRAVPAKTARIPASPAPAAPAPVIQPPLAPAVMPPPAPAPVEVVTPAQALLPAAPPAPAIAAPAPPVAPVPPAEAPIRPAEFAAAPTAAEPSAPPSGRNVTMPRPQVPAPARLRYDVVATDQRTAPPTLTYGKGTVRWTADAERYRLDLLASVDVLLFSLDVLASHSEGLLDSQGLAPVRYTETPRRRPALATNFNRGAGPLANTITFSATTGSQPLEAGSQDRLSVLFQLAGLLRAEPRLAEPGQELRLHVAGIRGDAEFWVFQVLGRETIRAATRAGSGPVETVHVRRAAKVGSNDRTVDLWYALEQGGYPAQIRYTETNGNRIELVLAGYE